MKNKILLLIFLSLIGCGDFTEDIPKEDNYDICEEFFRQHIDKRDKRLSVYDPGLFWNQIEDFCERNEYLDKGYEKKIDPEPF